MKTYSLMKKLALGLAVAGLMAHQAGAVTYTAYNLPSGLAGNQSPGGPFSLGNLFTVNSPIQVTALGAFNPSGTFGSGGVSVAIYSVSIDGGNNITSSSVAVNAVNFSGAQAVAGGTQTSFSPVTPVTLADGTYLVVANNYGQTGAAINYNPVSDVSNAMGADSGHGVVSSQAGYYSTSANLNPLGWSYDNPGTGGATSPPRYGAGDFQYNLVAVPETATFATASVALLGLVYVGRCGLRKHKVS